MLRGGTELLAGLLQDPVFGPLVAFGPGGVFAELIGEASLRIAPLTDIDAEELVTSARRAARARLPRRRAGRRRRHSSTRPAARGARRRPARRRRARPQSGARLPDRAVAVDARVRIRRPVQQRRDKSW
jgi:hypothetical protein